MAEKKWVITKMDWATHPKEGDQVPCPGTRFNPETRRTETCPMSVWINRVKKDGPNYDKMMLICDKEKGGCGYFGFLAFEKGKFIGMEEGVWNASKRKAAMSTVPNTKLVPNKSDIVDLTVSTAPHAEEPCPKRAKLLCTECSTRVHTQFGDADLDKAWGELHDHWLFTRLTPSQFERFFADAMGTDAMGNTPTPTGDEEEPATQPLDL